MMKLHDLTFIVANTFFVLERVNGKGNSGEMDGDDLEI
jgi:hypothetical protein